MLHHLFVHNQFLRVGLQLKCQQEAGGLGPSSSMSGAADSLALLAEDKTHQLPYNNGKLRAKVILCFARIYKTKQMQVINLCANAVQAAGKLSLSLLGLAAQTLLCVAFQ